ncbi:MAG: lysozyme precursor [Bacteroidetes bacterium]|nr:MAG: lysozyme precursor [Bacteroidota bacterium]
MVTNASQSPAYCSGIDVSHHQGTIDWSKLKSADPAIGLVNFVYIKATEGVGYIDPMALTYAQGAKAAGLRIGYYHFASLNDPNVSNDAAAEARYFDSQLKTLPAADLVPVLDLETNKSNLSPQLVQQWITAFLDTMNQLGYPSVMLYSYQPFLDQYLPAGHPFGKLPLWLAQYRNVPQPTLPKGWTAYTIWQYSNQGKLAGFTTNVDLNKAVASFC